LRASCGNIFAGESTGEVKLRREGKGHDLAAVRAAPISYIYVLLNSAFMEYASRKFNVSFFCAKRRREMCPKFIIQKNIEGKPNENLNDISLPMWMPELS
jgi:hypothetical protein